VTSVVVTHDMRSARRVGNRLLMFARKKDLRAGKPEEIFSSTDPVVHRLSKGISDPKEHHFDMSNRAMNGKSGCLCCSASSGGLPVDSLQQRA